MKHSVTLTLPNVSHFAVAVSGGADSMALALMAQQHCRQHGAKLTALTVDHTLRKESTAEAKQVHRWLSRHGIEHHTLTWKHGKITGNLQEQARNARYALLGAWCKRNSAEALLVAHTQNDQAETLLMRLKRGSFIEGLSAMRTESLHHDMLVLRPLLHIPKSTLVAYLQSRNQPWIEDPSNENMDFDRIKLRKALQELPHPARRIEQLAAAAEQFGQLRQKREAEVAAFFKKHRRTPSPIQGEEINIEAFRAAGEDLQHRLLLALLHHTTPRPHPPRGLEVQRLQQAIHTQESGIRTLAHCRIDWNPARLAIRPEHT